MCVLHVNIDTDQLDFIIESTKLPIYQVYKKGDKHKYLKKKVYDYNVISCVVSDKDWDDFEGQANDMLSFLKTYHIELQSLKDNFNDLDWQFDMPYNCRLSDSLFNQNNFLPPELLALAGYFGIGINLSLYWPGQEEESDTQKRSNN
jgi:hypothetical protein